ncbi:hypothetical protein ET475_13570 [Microbacterium protaetiae]|uniref:DUF4747 family protein n=1 Tax=Microbacterium protaetiae TaxID=2509458 RepID=A0A4P6EF57_9MICO|nr:hypothetical protein [Microbacterium protaetiae]QAY60915.1 hypothetical protein ET475_13570 [Microbacterium protaetiae]
MRQIPVRFYSLHIHSGGEAVDYQLFFHAMQQSIRSEVAVATDYTVVLDEARLTDATTIELVFFGGDQNGQTIYYDRSEGAPIVEAASPTRWSAKPTRAVISANDSGRIVALESGRGGVTPLLLERFFERVPLVGFSDRRVEITPLASKSFLTEIDAFVRIRVAAVEVARPNYDWADHANRLYELADESNAATSTAEVKAARGESLDKAAGLVAVIRDVAESPNPSIRNARVTGRKPGDTAEQTVTLSKHQERSLVALDQTMPLDAQTSGLLDAFRNLIARVRNRHVSDHD